MSALLPRAARWAGALLVAVGLSALMVLAGFNVGWSDQAMRDQLSDRAQETSAVWASYIQFRMDMLAAYLESHAAETDLATLVTAGASGRAEISARLTSLQADYPTVSSMSVLDRAGRVVATTAGRQFVGHDESLGNGYRGALAARATYQSAAYRSALPGQPWVVDVITPIRLRARAAPVGYLTATPSLAKARSFSAASTGSSALSMALIDQRGATILASDNRAPGRVDARTSVWLARARHGDAGTTTIGAGDDRAVVSYRPLSNGWFVAVELPESTVLSPLGHLRNMTLVLTAGLALLIVVAGALLLHGNRLQRRAIQRLETTRAELADALAQLRAQADERQRIAREVNDTIVQGLVAAEVSYDLDEGAHTRDLLRQTSRQARAWVGELLVEAGPLEPGTARRQGPAHHLTGTPQ